MFQYEICTIFNQYKYEKLQYQGFSVSGLFCCLGQASSFRRWKKLVCHLFECLFLLISDFEVHE